MCLHDITAMGRRPESLQDHYRSFVSVFQTGSHKNILILLYRISTNALNPPLLIVILILPVKTQTVVTTVETKISKRTKAIKQKTFSFQSVPSSLSKTEYQNLCGSHASESFRFTLENPRYNNFLPLSSNGIQFCSLYDCLHEFRFSL